MPSRRMRESSVLGDTPSDAAAPSLPPTRPRAVTECVLDALPGIARPGARGRIDREVRQLEQGRLQHLVPREDHRALDDVLQLAHVARPRVARRARPAPRARARDAPAASCSRSARGEVLGQQRMSSRRSRSGGTAIGDARSAGSRGPRGSAPAHAPRAQVAVGGGDDAHVDRRAAARRPTRSNSPLLQHAQQLAPAASSAQLADLVEEDACRRRPARSGPSRRSTAPVKAPRSWPKSSLSSRLAGSARAVDRDERPRRARGCVRGCARAISSLPVPVSPVISTVAVVGATRATRSITPRRAAELPRMKTFLVAAAAPPGARARSVGEPGAPQHGQPFVRRVRDERRVCTHVGLPVGGITEHVPFHPGPAIRRSPASCWSCWVRGSLGIASLGRSAKASARRWTPPLVTLSRAVDSGAGPVSRSRPVRWYAEVPKEVG